MTAKRNAGDVEETAPLLHAGVGGETVVGETRASPRAVVWFSVAMIAAGCLVLVVGAAPMLLRGYWNQHHLPASVSVAASASDAPRATVVAAAAAESLPPTADNASSSDASGRAYIWPTTHEGDSLLEDPIWPYLSAPFKTLLPHPKDHRGIPLILNPDSPAWTPDASWAHVPSSSSSSIELGVGGGRRAGKEAEPISKFSLCVDGGPVLWDKVRGRSKRTGEEYKYSTSMGESGATVERSRVFF